ncbi:flavonoid 3',5'-hydroxylase [Amniculicola lignicola CBS 123094]|uniref:Flavonoid 3',5'-hydroxylase n=1 Tax=Amniculicola lignicola CBS 123094 TaxID=1392246 RepID=A0A6A5WC55_9PLEO|nr:flavonoid 3',5'-hydroxylase [Amniculicola lignicola CBS 123094]
MSTNQDASSSRIVSLLTPLNILLALSAFITFKIAHQIIHYRFFHPLRNFPGPFWASVTRLWIAYHNIIADECELELALHKKYGPVLRITPTLLLVSDATKLPEVYNRQSNKSNHYITGSFGKTESLFNMQDHKHHAHFRKIAAGPYAFSNIKKMEPMVDRRIEGWLDRIGELFGNGEKFDFAPWAVYMAYDIISEIGFGAPFGFVDSGSDVGGLIQGFHDGLLPFGLMARLWPFTHWIKSTWIGEKYLVAKPEDDSGIGMLMRFRDKLIIQRQQDLEEGKKGRVDLLQTFLDARTEKGEPLEMEYIKAEILLVLLAGADTTGTAFQAMMAYIMSNASVYEKLMREIDEQTKAGRLSKMPLYDEVLAHCPYYVACVRESMRLCPSAPNIFPRVVGPTGMDLYGNFAPPGTEITCNPWLVHRDSNVYGPDVLSFRPERWLESEEKTKEYMRLNMAFGYGARVCLGKDIALMELYKAPLQFFRMFRPEIVNREVPGRFVVKGGVGFWEDMWIRVERRLKCGG